VLRWAPDLDRLIDSATQLRLADDAKARSALRLALAGQLVLGTPPHAAIATVLPLVDGGPRRLVHGVFGTLMRSGAALPAVPTLPETVAARWSAAWGSETVEAAARALAEPPPLDLSLRDPATTGDWAARLDAQSPMPGQLRLAPGRPVPELPGYDEGAWWVQDIAATIPARLLGRGGGRALDLCAAPGGKTLQLAAAGWQVTALDRSESRLARLRENLARTGLSAEIVAADALDWTPDAPFDAVLLDAPCSATGIFRRHPDVLHRVPDMEGLTDLQARLLARAAEWVRPGGTLVYATCSLEPAEGEEQATAFLASRPDYVAAPGDVDLAPGLARESEGRWRVLPGAVPGGCDGFFAARFRRQE
jgi:16S rRNA (cytosine967-C5)-methyltransferase